eukprot:m.852539 g.852539  ORF g.852539 m.852539 type:complete len:1121 (+) comp59600_c0_seq6:176-3538(+)
MSQSRVAPSWYHGDLSRQQAEDMLTTHGRTEGIYVVRDSVRNNGHVISAFLCGEFVHFQIHVELRSSRVAYFYDTETAKSGEFPSLISLVQYVIANPEILPAPLTRPIPNPYSKPVRQYFKIETEQFGFSDDEEALPTPPPRTVQGPVSSSTSPQQGSPPSTISTPVPTTAPKETGIVAVRSLSGQTASASTRASTATPPPPSSATGSAKTPMSPGQLRRFASSKVSLSSVMMGRKPFHKVDAISPKDKTFSSLIGAKSEVFYKDTLKSDWLSKLPPTSNSVQGWRRRYFQLTILLTKNVVNTGPVILIYFESPTASKPKGAIDLNLVQDVSRVPDSRILSDKRYKNILPGTLFEITTPERVYPLWASSEQSVSDWIVTLREVLGFNELSPKATRKVSASLTSVEEYHGLILNENLGNHDGILLIKAASVALKCPQTGAMMFEVPFPQIKSFGHVKHIVWFEVSERSSHGGGMFCFSTTSGEAAFASLSARVEAAETVSGTTLKRRISRRHNMSWSSVDSSEDLLDGRTPAVPQREKIPEVTASGEPCMRLYGKNIPLSVLTFGGYAVARSTHVGRRDEISFSQGDRVPILKCDHFLPEYYVQEIRPRFYKFVPARLVHFDMGTMKKTSALPAGPVPAARPELRADPHATRLVEGGLLGHSSSRIMSSSQIASFSSFAFQPNILSATTAANDDDLDGIDETYLAPIVTTQGNARMASSGGEPVAAASASTLTTSTSGSAAAILFSDGKKQKVPVKPAKEPVDDPIYNNDELSEGEKDEPVYNNDELSEGEPDTPDQESGLVYGQLIPDKPEKSLLPKAKPNKLQSIKKPEYKRREDGDDEDSDEEGEFEPFYESIPEGADPPPQPDAMKSTTVKYAKVKKPLMVPKDSDDEPEGESTYDLAQTVQGEPAYKNAAVFASHVEPTPYLHKPDYDHDDDDFDGEGEFDPDYELSMPADGFLSRVSSRTYVNSDAIRANSGKTSTVKSMRLEYSADESAATDDAGPGVLPAPDYASEDDDDSEPDYVNDETIKANARKESPNDAQRSLSPSDAVTVEIVLATAQRISVTMAPEQTMRDVRLFVESFTKDSNFRLVFYDSREGCEDGQELGGFGQYILLHHVLFI